MKSRQISTIWNQAVKVITADVFASWVKATRWDPYFVTGSITDTAPYVAPVPFKLPVHALLWNGFVWVPQLLSAEWDYESAGFWGWLGIYDHVISTCAAAVFNIYYLIAGTPFRLKMKNSYVLVTTTLRRCLKKKPPYKKKRSSLFPVNWFLQGPLRRSSYQKSTIV